MNYQTFIDYGMAYQEKTPEAPTRLMVPAELVAQITAKLLNAPYVKDPTDYVPTVIQRYGVDWHNPSTVYPDCYVPVNLNEQSVMDMSMGELCDAMKACFYAEPGGTDTMRCAKLLRAIHDTFKHASY